MTAHVTSTPRTYLVNGQVVREWQGTTENGTPIILYVALVKLPSDHQEELYRDVVEVQLKPGG